MDPRSRRFGRGFTLIELLVVIALIAIILAITLPSFKKLIINQRLKSVTSQLVADLQFARAEAATRNMPVLLSFRTTSTRFCYTIYTNGDTGARCNCTTTCGPSGTATQPVEIRRVNIPVDGGIELEVGTQDIAFDNVNGGLLYNTLDFGSVTPTSFRAFTRVIEDTTREIRTDVSPAGRPTSCSLGTTPVTGYPSC